MRGVAKRASPEESEATYAEMREMTIKHRMQSAKDVLRPFVTPDPRAAARRHGPLANIKVVAARS